jgi:hypothetical protein
MDDHLEALLRRIDAQEQRVRLLEDHVAIYQLLAGYGPAVDAGASEIAASRWSEAGSYDAQVGEWVGREAIAGMVEGDFHQLLISSGCAHVLSMPYVVVDGDRAVATSHGRLYRRDELTDSFRVWRVTATRWELIRSEGGWLVERRVNKLLDGDAEARHLLERGVAG